MIDVRIKKLFLDRPAVIRAVGAARVRALTRIGGRVRTVARRSIRRRRAVSRPGSPPSSHVGTLRDNIFFSYDTASKSVVVGPALTATARRAQPLGGSTVPSLLEVGGEAKRGTRGLLYRPRPYMGPALDEARQSRALETAWREVLK